MKKKKTFVFGLALFSIITTGCVDKDYGPDEKYDKLTTPTNVVSTYKQGDSSHESKPLEETKIVRLHYRRKDDTDNNRKVYEPWNIWAWDITNGGNGDAYNFTHYDNYGVYVDLDLNIIGGGQAIESLGFIVRTDNWAKDPDGDRSIEVNKTSPGGIQDVYVRSGDITLFTTPQNALKSSVDCAIMDSFNDISVFFKPITKEFKAYPKRFSIEINGEPYTNFTLKEYDDTKKKATLELKDKLDITDTINVFYKFDSEWTNEVPLMITSYFDTQEFKTNFSYTGNDLGATFDNEMNPSKTIFKLWAPTTKSVTLNVYSSGDYEKDKTPLKTINMEKGEKGVFQTTVNEDLDGKYYTYTVNNSKGINEVVDPYAKSAGLNGRRGMIVNFNKVNSEIAGWNTDTRPNFGNASVDGSIYEMHVRDMTINPNSGVTEQNRGKFLGLTEKNTSYKENGVTVSTGLDNLKELGITHVQIQPFYDFSSVDESSSGNTMSKTNYNWGYDPLNYNVLEGSYSTDPTDGYNRIKEFKQMVMAMHSEGININMDVVYNHTSSTENSNFNLIVPYYYYRTFASGKFYNGSGCGNEMASNRFMVNKFIRESCKFWIDEYHLSGFRFDLMGLLDNQTMIDVYKECKELYSNIMVYGEPWTGGTTKLKDGTDASKLTSQKTVQRSLAQSYFAGDNVLVGAFNDVIRNAVRGDNAPGRGFVQGLYANGKTILQGIQGQFSNGSNAEKNINPNQVLNYVSCHDNYTLEDQLLQSMGNADITNAYTQAESLIFLAQGVPFMQEGEEFRRSKYNEEKQKYEGNSYNTGDFDNNMDYSLKIKYPNIYSKFKELIKLRKDYSEFRLSTRQDITDKVTNMSAEGGNIIYEINDLLIIHCANAAGGMVNLSSNYEMIFSNIRDMYTSHSTQLSLFANESVVLKKLS